MLKRSLLSLCLVASLTACSQASDPQKDLPSPTIDLKEEGKKTAEIVLAAGCFWSTEAVFERVPGVIDVVSGYSGGEKETAEYNSVGRGDTGHAESVKIIYDPSKVTFGQLLRVYFGAAHDPTQLNRQGNDVGKQYRSTIFYANDGQKKVIESYVKQLTDDKVFAEPIVTTLEKFKAFYAAEDYHQDYSKLHPNEGYMKYVLPHKLEKLNKVLKK